MEEGQTSRFEELADEEAVLIAMGLTLLLMDALFGVINEPWPAESLAEKFPIFVRLMNDLGQRFDVELDSDLVKQAEQVIAMRAEANNN